MNRRRKNIALFLFFSTLLSPLSSFGQEGYYLLRNEVVELRRVAEPGEVGNWENISDKNGASYQSSKNPEISAEDIGAILVEKDPYWGGFRVSLLFKKSSWEKIRTVTTRFKNRIFLVLKGGEIFLAPRMAGALTESAGLSLDAGATRSFVQGLASSAAPSKAQQEADSIEYRVGRLKKSPGDMETMESLAYLYVNGVHQDCGKASVLFEKLLQKRPSHPDYYFKLGACYLQLQNYDGAAEVFQRAVQNAPENHEAVFRASLAEVYKIQGKKPLALEEFKKSLELFKNRSGPGSFQDSQQQEERLEKLGLGQAYREIMGSAAPDTARLIKEQEAELIKKIENEIETLKKTQ